MKHNDWSKPTKYIDRFTDAITILCGGNKPHTKIILDWLDDSIDSEALQEFCIEYSPLAWAQGVSIIDAATILADNPTEGVDHEYTNPYKGVIS